ncbi:MAG: hypothetical protein BV456_12665 [Thermoplasmata archaeon M8B2D]|nr:MAG: hypothetical protein BV456_12665 [Thermoplasmata archaeon M8B2D]
MQERENLLRIFKETRAAIDKGDIIKIKSLSDQTTNTASLTHDPDNIAVAVIVYSLSKILERENYRNYPGWSRFYNSYLKSIDNIISSLEKNDEAGFKKNLQLIRDAIDKISGKLKEYIQDVFRKASINKASKLYEHGISMEKTASLLGVSLFDLASYAGERGNYEGETPVNVKQRIKMAMDLFS